MIYRVKSLLGKTYRYALFLRDFYKFKNLSEKTDDRFTVKFADTWAHLYDNSPFTYFSTHYVYHPAWAARIVANIKPLFHTDISSTLYFATIVSAFLPVKFYDYRPAKLNLTSLTSEKADLLSLPFEDNSIESISCLHTLEHIGLGRYGDRLDPVGDKKAIEELKRVTKTGGSLIIAVPIGKPRIIYNAHRIYSYDQITSYFSGFRLKEFSLITDDAINKGMNFNSSKEEADKQNYGCGCFWFIKE